MRLAIIGSGYVGLVTAACFAESGHDVSCVDVDSARIDSLREGRVPFYEPGLSELVTAQRARLHFDTTLREPVELIFIAVNAPLDDVTALDRVVAALADASTVVLKSTVAVGTAAHLARKFPSHTFVSNPEFLREGSALADFRSPARVVIGTADERARRRVASLYAGAPVLFMDSRSAELAKLAANAMLATRVSVMNELARLADSHGADITRIRDVLGSDPRIGSAFLDAGIGFGGSCLPKDLGALSTSSPLFAAIDDANLRARHALVDKALAHFSGSLRGKRLGVWGLSFKPNTDDTRESPALAVTLALLELGAQVTVFDPRARDARLNHAASPEAAATDAEALFILTEWPEFTRVDLAKLATVMKHRVIFDGRNLLEPSHARSQGFTWFGVGRTN
ncbi:MAG: UDP-glucose/GDP-mannose dehydrogenase family protein [Archangium sp.]